MKALIVVIGLLAVLAAVEARAFVAPRAPAKPMEHFLDNLKARIHQTIKTTPKPAETIKSTPKPAETIKSTPKPAETIKSTPGETIKSTTPKPAETIKTTPPKPAETIKTTPPKPAETIKATPATPDRCDCHPDARCTRRFTCKCKRGFVGDGYECCVRKEDARRYLREMEDSKSESDSRSKRSGSNSNGWNGVESISTEDCLKILNKAPRKSEESSSKSGESSSSS